METVRLGGLYDKETKKHQMGSVWDKNHLCPNIDTMQGGYREPMIIEKVGNIYPSGGQNGNVYAEGSLSPTISSGTTGTIGNGGVGSNNAPKIIVAMRGRNPENPSDRTPGIPTEQRLEPNSQGLCNTLTSVQKDNLVLEKDTKYRFFEQACDTFQNNDCKPGDTIDAFNKKVNDTGVSPTITTRPEGLKTAILPVVSEKVGIKQATKKGYIECEVGGVADFSFLDSKLRRGRVQEGGNVSPTLMAGGNGVCKIEKGEQMQYRIRKLTPKECWRLMGFSDENFHKAEQVNSNTQLYKQAGNSIVVDVLEAIFSNFF